LPQVSEL